MRIYTITILSILDTNTQRETAGVSTASYSKNMAVKVMKLEIYFPSDYIRHPGGGGFLPLSKRKGERKPISIWRSMMRRWGTLYKHIDSRRLCRQVDLHLPPLALFLSFLPSLVSFFSSSFSFPFPGRVLSSISGATFSRE